jgi:hypothetical protein
LALVRPAAGQLLNRLEAQRTGALMAKKIFLDFEQSIAELENKIDELRYVQTESAVDISSEIDQLAKKSLQLTKDVYSQLTPWQITKIARHAERPYTLDYLSEIFTHFVEMTKVLLAAWPVSMARPAWCLASKKGATPKSAGCAISV